MDELYWEITRNVLQSDSNPLFKKPRLTEALLRRPPFRFLHDVVTAVQKRTGFASELWTEAETDAKALGDSKEGKIAYLWKLIRAVEDASGERLDVDPLKIAAGLEPERTNALLQTLGRVALSMTTQPPPVAETKELRRPPSRRGTADLQPAEILQPSTEMASEGNVEILKLDESDGEEEERPEPPFVEPRTTSGVTSRPQTAKKGPPSFGRVLQEPPRRPPSRGMSSRPGSRRGTPVAPLRPLSSESDIEIETESASYPADASTVEGALVRDLKQETLLPATECTEPGIILPRRRRPVTETPSTDLSSLRDALSACNPLSATLARCFESLLEAIDRMEKERVYWQSEAERLQELLKTQVTAPTSSSDAFTQQELAKALTEQRQKLRTLKETSQQNAKTIDAMLHGLTQS